MTQHWIEAAAKELREHLDLITPYMTVEQIADILRRHAPPVPDRPTIVCLCGSTRFYDAFQEANYRETMAGRIVLSVGFYPHSSALAGHGEGVGHDSAEKVKLDELHKRKIDLADEVLILNVGGYVGSSTKSELNYAIEHGKKIRWLESGPLPPAPETKDRQLPKETEK